MMQPATHAFLTARSGPKRGRARLLPICERSRPLFALLGWLMLLAILYATLSTIEQRPRISSLAPRLDCSLIADRYGLSMPPWQASTRACVLRLLS